MEKIKKLDKTMVVKNVRQLIFMSRFTNEELAEKLDVSTRLVYHWQKGTRIPNIDNIYGLSQLFQVSIESILL